jgi:hypothetical protein
MAKAFAHRKGATMAGPTDALILQFEHQYDHLYQQMMSRLERHVRIDPAPPGILAAFGLLGPVDVQEITGERHGSTSWTDSPSTRRWAPKRVFEVPQMLDKQDDLAILINLQMGYAQNGVYSMERKIDKLIIDAVTGTAASGAFGTETSTFDTAVPVADGTGGNQIAVGGTGLTLDKMRTARAIFDVREVGLDGMSMGLREFVWVMSAKNHQDLLEQTEATSTDYLGVVIVTGGEEQRRMPLVGGRIPHYMGFDLVISNQLNTTSSNRINLAWHKSAMGFARWGGQRRIWVGELPEHHLAMGVIVQEHMGAVRIQNNGVLAIVCDET